MHRAVKKDGNQTITGNVVFQSATVMANVSVRNDSFGTINLKDLFHVAMLSSTDQVRIRHLCKSNL